MVKDQDYLKKKASFCIDLAKKLGATDSSVAVMHSISETVNFRNRKLDESDRSDSLGVGLETYIGKKKSGITSSNLNEDNIKTLIERCIETTKITPEDECNSLPDKDLLAKKINDLNLYDDDHIENNEKIEYLKEVEEAALKKKEIINTETGFTESKSLIFVANKSWSGKELNSSAGVIFVVSIHLSIKVLILSSLRLDDVIPDFFLPI